SLDRRLTTVARGADPWVEVDGRKLLNLSSNNYLGLANHPVVVAAAAEAGEKYGWGAGSSRLVAGSSPLCDLLEERLAQFKGSERALLFTSGYTANVGLIPSLVGPGDVVVGDELNHASLIDGCRLSRADFSAFRHRNVEALDSQLARAVRHSPRGRRLVVTDTVFSMDGDLAPLEAIAEVCDRYEAMLVVDEAHATGCIGAGGRGLVSQLGMEDRVTAAVGTLSKALGSFGAFVSGERLLADYLVSTARSFMFTTALPPPVVAASVAALDLLEANPALVDQLQENAGVLRAALRASGFDTGDSETQIIPVLVGDSGTAVKMASALRQEGVYAVAIRPPTVPANAARIRVSAMATHTRDDLTFAIETFVRVGERIGLLASAGSGASRVTGS